MYRLVYSFTSNPIVQNLIRIQKICLHVLLAFPRLRHAQILSRPHLCKSKQVVITSVRYNLLEVTRQLSQSVQLIRNPPHTLMTVKYRRQRAARESALIESGATAAYECRGYVPSLGAYNFICNVVKQAVIPPTCDCAHVANPLGTQQATLSVRGTHLPSQRTQRSPADSVASTRFL